VHFAEDMENAGCGRVLINEKKRREKLLDQVLAEAELFAQSKYLEVNGVKNNQTLLAVR
jgi:hypothetical protein